MGLLGNSGGGSPGFPSVLPSPLRTSGINNYAETTDTDPANIMIKGPDAYAQAATNTSGGDLTLAAGLGRRFVTVVDYSLIDAGADTITITVNGTANVGTEGTQDATHWKAQTSNAVTATNIATWADQLSGVSAVAVGAVCYITADSTTYSLTLATGMAAGEGTVTSGTDGALTLSNSSFVGVSKFASGTAAAPSIAFTAFPTDGIYSSGNGQVAVTAAGTLRVFFGNGNSVWSSTEAFGYQDAAIGHGGANSLNFGGTTPSAGAATTRTEINKAVTAFSNGVAKATFTVTIPNAAHSAMLKVTVVGSLGAGGAIGANEATGTISYDIAIARTAGVAAVATASSAYGSATSAVAGAATITVAAAVSAIAGAVGDPNTFTVDVTITRGSGFSDNHTATVYGRLVNANASGITIA